MRLTQAGPLTVYLKLRYTMMEYNHTCSCCRVANGSTVLMSVDKKPDLLIWGLFKNLNIRSIKIFYVLSRS